MGLSNFPDTCKLFLDFNILLTAWGHTRTKQMTGGKTKEVTATRQVMLTLIYCAAYCLQPLTPNNTHHQPVANKTVGKCFQHFISQTISSAKLKQQSPRKKPTDSWLLTDLSHKSNQLPKQRNKQQQKSSWPWWSRAHVIVRQGALVPISLSGLVVLPHHPLLRQLGSGGQWAVGVVGRFMRKNKAGLLLLLLWLLLKDVVLEVGQLRLQLGRGCACAGGCCLWPTCWTDTHFITN